MSKKRMKRKSSTKVLKRTPFEIEIDKTIQIAKHLGYTKLFPDLTEKLKKAKSEDELSKIMCRQRNRLILLEEQERQEKQNKERNKEDEWLIKL